MDLSPEEVRVLGCLIEKSHTTPDHYPLSTNALVSACNQKSNRDPVVTFSAREVDSISTELRGMGLVRVTRGTGMRTHKHKHVVDEVLELSAQEQAVLGVLMLRGPQSHGELRTRTDRYVEFADNDAVLEVLGGLQDRPERFVVNIGRESGQSQDRWKHTLSSTEPAGETTPAETESHQLDSGSRSLDSTTSAGRAQQAQLETSSPQSAPTTTELEQRIVELERRLAAVESSLGTT